MSGNFGDLDNDGWLDFYLGTGGPDYRALVPNRMFRDADGKPSRMSPPSGGSYGASSLQQQIGLGDATSIRSLEVSWPTSGKRQVLQNLKTNQILTVRESDADLPVAWTKAAAP